MKAKEYYELYRPAVKDHAPMAIQIQMMRAFQDEFHKVCDQRKHTISARDNLIREFNDKWNAVARLFETKDGKTILETDAFINHMLKGDTKKILNVLDLGAFVRNWYHGRGDRNK